MGNQTPTPQTRPAQRPGVARGVACLFRGQAFVLRRPRLWPLGLLPAVVTFAVLAAAVVLLAVNTLDLVTWATPFADGWSARVRDVVRVAAAVALVALAVWLSVVLFVSFTLLLGEPFYERLSRRLDEELSDAPAEVDEVWHRGLRRSIGETVAMLVRTVPAGLVVFIVGLVPVVGQVAGPVVGALVGGRFLGLELIAPAMERRGRYLDGRLALARHHRGAVLGFGVPAFALFLVPLLAVVLMPGAVAGATLLIRELVDQEGAK